MSGLAQVRGDAMPGSTSAMTEQPAADDAHRGPGRIACSAARPRQIQAVIREIPLKTALRRVRGPKAGRYAVAVTIARSACTLSSTKA
jgi:hypothetical protein